MKIVKYVRGSGFMAQNKALSAVSEALINKHLSQKQGRGIQKF